MCIFADKRHTHVVLCSCLFYNVDASCFMFVFMKSVIAGMDIGGQIVLISYLECMN